MLESIARITLVAALTLLGLSPAHAEFRRLGDQERRVELARLETRPFPAEHLASLESWTGEPLTPEDIEGEVVVLLAWDSEQPRSVRLLPTLARLERTRGDDVIFLAVHTAERWGSAQDKIESGRVRCLVAHDAQGSLLAALDIDDHPNLYLIDRSGHTRVADIDPRDLPRAISALVRETPEQARADLPRRIERLGELRELVAEKPSPTDYPGPRTGSPESSRPPIPQSAYSRAAWPARNTNLNANDLQQQRLEAPAGTETWLTPRPERPVRDHVVVLDFWATWCGPCIAASPKLDALQQAHRDELLVLAMAGQAAGSKWPEDEAAIRRYIDRHPVSYSHLHDDEQTLYKKVQPRGIPHVVVISTDGVVRWQGNPHSPRFADAVRTTIQADPLLAARRASAGRD